MCFTRSVLREGLHSTVVAVIGDLVGSRRAENRESLQQSLNQALQLVNERWASVDPFAPTVGDEVQGVCDNVFRALDATLFIRVSIPPPYDIRFGIGIGEVTWVEREPSTGFRRQDGPAWWLARDAINFVAEGGRSAPKTLRTWVAAARPDDRTDTHALFYPDLPADARTALLNAYLAARDHLVSRMDARDRRILQGMLLRQTLQAIAEEEEISVSAVSQRVQRSGASAIMYGREGLTHWYTLPESQD